MRVRPLPAAGAAILAVIVLAASYLLLNACGLRFVLPFGLRDECPEIRTVRSFHLDEALERRRALEGRVAGLERAIADLRCAPERRSEQEVLPTDPGTAADSDGPSGPGIREEDWENRDVALLEGCWSLDSDYSLENVDTGAVSGVESWQMCFDEEGIGSQTLTFDDGRTCESERTEAEFAPNGNLLVRDGENVSCDDGSFIYEREMNCSLDRDGGASCASVQEETGSRSNVQIRR